MITLSALILVSKYFTASRLIGEILIPSFLTKDIDLQMEVTKVVPVIACMSMGNYTINLNVFSDCNSDLIFKSGTIDICVVCSNCHKRNADHEMFALCSENNLPTSGNIVTNSGLRNLLCKFLNSKQYVDVDKTEYWNMVARFSKHFYAFTNGVPPEIVTDDNCQHVIKALQPHIENNLVCISIFTINSFIIGN